MGRWAYVSYENKKVNSLNQPNVGANDRIVLPLLLVGFLEDVNWWGVIRPPWDLENRKAYFDGVNAIRFLSSWTTRNVFENPKNPQIWGSGGQK